MVSQAIVTVGRNFEHSSGPWQRRENVRREKNAQLMVSPRCAALRIVERPEQRMEYADGDSNPDQPYFGMARRCHAEK